MVMSAMPVMGVSRDKLLRFSYQKALNSRRIGADGDCPESSS